MCLSGWFNVLLIYYLRCLIYSFSCLSVEKKISGEACPHNLCSSIVLFFFTTYKLFYNITIIVTMSNCYYYIIIILHSFVVTSKMSYCENNLNEIIKL